MTAPTRRRLTRIFGLLLTPIVAWAASFLGAWIAATLSGIVDSDRIALALTVLAGLVGAVVAVLFWLRWISRFREGKPAEKTSE